MKKISKIKPNTLFSDVEKNEWKFQNLIGTGGFGQIYTISCCNSNKYERDECAIKIEPSINGTLFCEMYCYMHLKKSKINIIQWLLKINENYLPLPRLISAGTCDIENIIYRFIIIQRFGISLEKYMEEKYKNKLPVGVAADIIVKMITALQFMHENDYAHGDVKALNILFGNNDPNKVYLIDFGIAQRFILNNEFISYNPNKKNKHNGTLMFTSCDMHEGADPTPRGDLESLGYNLVYWICGSLPWSNLKNGDLVWEKKLKWRKFIDIETSETELIKPIKKYMNIVYKLKYDEFPNYTNLRKLFKPFIGTISNVNFNTKIKKEKIPLSTMNAKSQPNKKIKSNGNKYKPVKVNKGYVRFIKSKDNVNID
ncbi:hypothetical protein A3Q56_04265 [Intoshia linei]|uniref:non-specific serine/threonine protein kinase n=1 Tax=Intoshia linei TaxID=1819745 RepID=A0A177B327_9BILA|nr:hypothetical protein A3Q56_04265 [Intoshia linei]